MIEIYSNFTDWVPWPNREQQLKAEVLSSPGVYVICARMDMTSIGKPVPSSRLLYVGETCGQTLKMRINQFDRSAFRGMRAHSGGKTFNNRARDMPSAHDLLVAVLPVRVDKPKDKPKQSAFIRYVERAIIWQHVLHHDDTPICNSK